MKRQSGTSIIRSAGRWYSRVAILAINTVLFVILLNVVSALALSAQSEHERAAVPPWATHLIAMGVTNWARVLYPGWDENSLRDLWAASGLLAYDYDAAAQYRMKPLRSKYYNIHEAGFRLNGNDALWPQDVSAFNIFVFGGST